MYQLHLNHKWGVSDWARNWWIKPRCVDSLHVYHVTSGFNNRHTSTKSFCTIKVLITLPYRDWGSFHPPCLSRSGLRHMLKSPPIIVFVPQSSKCLHRFKKKSICSLHLSLLGAYMFVRCRCVSFIVTSSIYNNNNNKIDL